MSDSKINVHVNTASRSYDVLIGEDLLAGLGVRVAGVSGARRIALISDETVHELYGSVARESLADAGFKVNVIVVPPGEVSKNWSTAGHMLENLADHGLGRKDLIVALGGGVIGDLAGFCAATYMRGIDFVQVPTTLLAQVDSSVGGKTGVDLKAGKNLAGAFLQPLLVVADTTVLGTLTEDDWASGLAETAKMAVLESEDRLRAVERDAEALRCREVGATREAIAGAVRFKAEVVAQDEMESGVRECLNLGHTLGHALENVLGYGVVPHGVAVGEGMRFAARLGATQPGGSLEFCARQESLLDALGLPALTHRVDVADIRAAMRSDKKSRGGVVRWVLPISPGQWRVESIEGDILDAELAKWATATNEGLMR